MRGKQIVSHLVYRQSQNFGIYQTTPSTIAISSWNPHQRGSRIQQYPSLATLHLPTFHHLLQTTLQSQSPPPASESKRLVHLHVVASACQSIQKQRTLLARKLGVVLGSMLLGFVLNLKLDCLRNRECVACQSRLVQHMLPYV